MTLRSILVSSLLIAGIASAAHADLLYGVTGGAALDNTIYRINTANNSQTVLFNTGKARVNGLAFDAATNNLYYRNGSGAAQGSLDFFRYNITSGVETPLALAASFPGTSTNAAFYNGGYWYVGQNTDELYRYDVAGGTTTTFTNFNGGTNGDTAFSFDGDIAISATGILYGSSFVGGDNAQGRFFSVDISDGTPTSADFQLLRSGPLSNTGVFGRQLAFDAAGTTLRGYRDIGGGGARPWVQIDTSNTVAAGDTALDPQLTNQFTFVDLAGAAIIPEAGSGLLTLLGVGLSSAVGVVLRRRRK